jgi:diguanylate cyclase (GGDEF)-like protein
VPQQLKLLLVEDSAADAGLALHELQRGGLACESVRVASEAAFRRELEEFKPEVILSDFSMPGFDGVRALALARELAADVPFIFVSGTIGEENAIRALHEGATDYVLKGNLRRLPAAVGRALREAETRRARRRAEERLHRLAHYDALTGLPNRHLFDDRLGLALATARRCDWRVGVMYIDLDDFKEVNDRFGHATGDRLLVHIGQCLRRAVRSGDTVARIGGDEFGAILPMLKRVEDAQVVARKLASALARPVEIDGRTLTGAASVGIAILSLGRGGRREPRQGGRLGDVPGQAAGRGRPPLLRSRDDASPATRGLASPVGRRRSRW